MEIGEKGEIDCKEVIREAEREKDEESECEREKRSCINSKLKVSLKWVTAG